MIDSGASFHTTTHHDVLENYIVGSHKKVYLADDEHLDIIRMCDVNLKMPNGLV